MSTRQTPEERLIWRMADIHWSVVMGDRDPPLREIPEVARDLYYQAMRAAISQIIPTQAMIDAAFDALTSRERAIATARLRSHPVRDSDRSILALKFAAMIKMLHNEGGGKDAAERPK